MRRTAALRPPCMQTMLPWQDAALVPIAVPDSTRNTVCHLRFTKCQLRYPRLHIDHEGPPHKGRMCASVAANNSTRKDLAMLNRNISKGLAMLALLFMLLPLLAQEAEVVETPAQALVRLSTTTVIPTVIVNKVAYAVGTEKGRPFQIRLEGGATQTFGIAKGRLAYRVDEDLYILDLQNGERRRALADYRVVNAAWNPSGTRVAAVVTRPEGLSLVISDLEEGPVTLVTSGTVLPDFVRWTSHGEVAYVVADTPDETKLLLLSDNGVVRSASIDRSSFPFLMGLTDAELTSDDLAVTLAASSNKEDAYPIAATDSAVWTASDGGLTIRARNNSIRSMIESAASTLTSGSGVQAAAAPATYGTYLGEYDSVQSYSNGNAGYVSNESNYINGTYIGMKWQCVEFVRRYYFSRFGLDLASKFTGDARDWWTGATAMNLDRFSNGGSTPPDPGDIIVSQGDGKNVGHVAIVRSRSANSVCTANQNLSNTAEQVNRCLTLNTSGSSYTLDGFGTAYPITGWLRRKSGGVSATAKAEITSPAPGNTLSSAVQTFAWTAGQGVSQYFFYAGTSAGNNNLYGNSTGTSRSVTVSNLPVNGSTIYIRLWSYIGSSWQFNDYQFRAAAR
jgi:hypothetical protein